MVHVLLEKLIRDQKKTKILIYCQNLERLKDCDRCTVQNFSEIMAVGMHMKHNSQPKLVKEGNILAWIAPLNLQRSIFLSKQTNAVPERIYAGKRVQDL